jgi:hypothetical protein
VNSRFFNSALGRSGFVNESIWDWFYWGARSAVLPCVLSLFALFALALCTECGAIAVARSARARSVAQICGRAAHRCQLHEVSVVSGCALLGSALALVGAWWYFAFHLPTFGKFIELYPDISTVSATKLSFLAPRFCLEDGAPNRVYRNGFAYVIVLGVSLWYPAVRLAIHKGEALGRGVVLGGASVLLLSLLLLDFPYRLIASADAREFPAVQWDKANCFIIGEKQIDLLLFCPAEPPPRNRVAHKNDPNLKETGSFRDIFADVEGLH